MAFNDDRPYLRGERLKKTEYTGQTIAKVAVDDLSEDQRKVYDAILDWYGDPNRRQFLRVGGLAGTGKGQPLDALVLTPFGYRTMGSLQVGSLVCNPDGSVARVLAVHELGKRDVFRVKFSDGATTLVTEDHLWLVQRSGKGLKADRLDMNGAPVWGRIERTADLELYVTDQQRRLRRGQRTYFPLVPLTMPVTLTVNNVHRRTPIAPYVLGALLGDGGMSQAQVMFTTADKEILRRVEHQLKVTLNGYGISYRIPLSTGIRDGLEELGLAGCLSHNKFIPEDYKTGSVEDRLELVRGLMDTDGTAGRLGGVTFTSTSRRMVQDLRWVLGSLGYRSTLTSRITRFRDRAGKQRSGRRSYTLHIQGRNLSDLFYLSRKQRRCKPFNGGVSEVARRMTHVVKSGRATCRCITVDHPNGLYITNDFIVTHNSTLTGLVAQELPNAVFGCFTGKAANNLEQKLRASEIKATCDTIHGLIYTPITSCQKCGEARTHSNHPAKHTFIDDGKVIDWWQRDAIKTDNECAPELIIIDEASMVGKRMWEDLMRYGIPVLAVGDHGQLPPVGTDTINLMEDPDLCLEKIHRQAADNPIIQYAHHLRHGGSPAEFKPSDDRVQFVQFAKQGYEKICADDKLEEVLDTAIIVYKNDTRTDCNVLVRSMFGRKGLPQAQDVVICLKNYKPFLFNGMRGAVLDMTAVVDMNSGEANPDRLYGHIEFPFDHLKIEGEFSAKQFNRKKTPMSGPLIESPRDVGMQFWKDVGLLFDYGYSLTAHKAQGSQFKQVVVAAYDVLSNRRMSSDERARWYYTAATRASDKLYVALGMVRR